MKATCGTIITASGGLVVLLSNRQAGVKSMRAGMPRVAYVDQTEHITEPVHTNEEGWGEFRCKPGLVSVWIPAGRKEG